MNFYCGPKSSGVRGAQHNYGCDQGGKGNLAPITHRAHDKKFTSNYNALMGKEASEL
jgi:hypothetical protein